MAKKKTYSVDIRELSKLSDNALARISYAIHAEMGHRGYAVIVWTPEEIGDANPRRVEDRSVELGWGIISDLGGPTPKF